MTLLGRDVGEIEALVTDRYLDALLAGPDAHLPVAPTARRRRLGRPGANIDDAVRLVSGRLAGDLPRFHPSFRFEERLALQLAEVAAAMRLPGGAAGANAQRSAEREPAGPGAISRLEPDPLAAPFDDEEAAGLGDGAVTRPILIGGAVAASAISLAGAAWLAWRRRSSGAAFGRAARAAHARRPARARARPPRAPLVRS